MCYFVNEKVFEKIVNIFLTLLNLLTNSRSKLVTKDAGSNLEIKIPDPLIEKTQAEFEVALQSNYFQLFLVLKFNLFVRLFRIFRRMQCCK